MFSVLFEVHPRLDQGDAYLGYAKLLRPELQRVEGFIDNIRYGSKRREGWVLSLSTWRDEKALVRWRTHAVHHSIQEKGRRDIFQDYHLRVAQVLADSHVPEGQALRDPRPDETEGGESKVVTLVAAAWPGTLHENASVETIAARLGFRADARGLIAWDLFEALLTPGDLLLLLSWRDSLSADAGEATAARPETGRRRRLKVVRDYGMFERYEAPQYYPEIPRGKR